MAKQIFGAGTLAIGPTASPTDQVECQVGNFVISSAANLIPIPATLCDSATSAASPSTFSCSITFMQDWGETVSLSQTLFDFDGSLLYFSYVPNDTSVPKADGQMWATAGDYGGAGQGLWVSTDELPCPEKPTISAQP